MTIGSFIRKSAFRNMRRSLLTITSMAFSMLLLSLLMTVWRTFFLDKGAPDSSLRLIARHRVSLTFFLPNSYRDKIRAIPGVKHVAPLTFYMGEYKDGRPENYFASIATDPNEYLDVAADKIVPLDQLKAWQRDRSGCIVDQHLAQRHGWKLGEHIHLKGTYFPSTLELTIRGMYTIEPPNDSLYFHHEYLEEVVGWLKGQSGVFLVRVNSPADVARVAATLDDMFHNSPHPTRSESEQTFRADFLAMMGNVKLFILFISGAVTFAIMLVTANTMAMSIRERTREVAVLRTLGFTSRRILALFLSESLTMASIGGLLGVCFCVALVHKIGAARGVGMPFGFHVSAATMLVALVTSSVLGVMSAVIPSQHAASKNIVDGLRYLG
ncbi:MAG: ABC transporter permease [Terriglobales bacterium]